LSFVVNHIYSFIHSWYFYSASSSPILLRGAPDYSIHIVLELTRHNTTALPVKDLPKVPTWQLIDRLFNVIATKDKQHCCTQLVFSGENNMWRARMYNNEQLFQQAKSLKTPSCDRLMKITAGR